MNAALSYPPFFKGASGQSGRPGAPGHQGDAVSGISRSIILFISYMQ